MSSFTRLGALLILPLLLACSDDEVTNLTREEVVGVYHLLTINDEPLPFVTDDEPVLTELVDLQITLNLNASFNERAIFRETEGTTVVVDTIFDNGAYELDGSNVQLHYVDGTLEGAFADGRLFFSGSGFTFIFERE
jgi:hypothetical protein